MTTVRQMHSLLNDGQHAKLIAELSQYRGDLPAGLLAELGSSVAVASALATIRLQELSQQRTTLYRALLARLIGSQESNGGWGDTLTTTIVIRALLGDAEGRAGAIRGTILLASLQKDDGSLPRETVRRLPGDALATAFALVHLARSQEFVARFRIEAAIHHLTQRRATVGATTLPIIKLAVQRASAAVGGQAYKLVQLAMAS